ncbi:hypothetical protein IQ06DRAFT_296497 [Phaeosphaeriaceae sp. SRC1lsM3a]|nr:hypothetical protein IQ06DRAFT_296497 [Stagonospora sp. SRC1lsM3a]
MLCKSIIAVYSLVASLQLIVADTLPTRPGPFGSCSGIATYQCPASSGCCFAGSCCGSGCCAATETCVYPNTPQAGCCRFDDPTLCGSKAIPPPAPASSDVPSNNPSSDPNCVAIRTCTVSGGHWQCLLGKPCGFTYGTCGTCPALLVSSRLPAPSAQSSAPIRPSPTASAIGGNPSGQVSSGTFTSSTSSTKSSASSSPSVVPAGSVASWHVDVRGMWKLVVAVVPAYALVI